MSLPELVVQRGVELAWNFFEENNYVLGYLCRELPLERQEDYRQLIRDEDVSIFMAYPTQITRIPSFSIVLKGESEDREGQFIGDAGPSLRDLPYPATDNEAAWDAYDELPTVRPDFKREEFEGVVYPDTEEPQLLGDNGDRSKQDVYHFSPRRKNLWQQRELTTTSEEQYEKMGEVQRLWHRDAQKLFATATGDRVNIDIIVTTENAEKTMIYYRMLRWAMRRFSTWFHVNGLYHPSYTGGDLSPNESLAPASGGPAYQRTLSMNFVHIDYSFEVESALAGFVFEMDLVTRRADGSLDFVPFYNLLYTSK